MPRQIAGWRHVDHLTDIGVRGVTTGRCYSERINSYRSLPEIKKLYKAYGDVKIVENFYMGSWYAEVYVKRGAKSSHMRFKNLR